MTAPDHESASSRTATAAKVLGARIAGDVVLPGDAGYHRVRRVWNARLNPPLGVQPFTTSETSPRERPTGIEPA